MLHVVEEIDDLLHALDDLRHRHRFERIEQVLKSAAGACWPKSVLGSVTSAKLMTRPVSAECDSADVGGEAYRGG